MLRSAVVMAAALVATSALGAPRLLVPLALGALYAAANDTPRHPAGRDRHLLLPAGAGALGLTTGLALHPAAPLLLLGGIAALGAVAGAASAFGPTGSAAGLQLLAMAAVAQGMPLPPTWWVPGAAVLVAAVVVVLLGPRGTPAPPGDVRLRTPPRVVVLRAGRLAVASVATTALALAWHPVRGYWLLVTVALVLAPEAGPVTRRAAHRALGTVVGVAAAGCLIVLGPDRLALAGAAIAAQALVPLAAAVSYGMLTTTVAPVVVSLLGLAGVPLTAGLLEARLVDTFVGVAIALAAGLVRVPVPDRSIRSERPSGDMSTPAPTTDPRLCP